MFALCTIFKMLFLSFVLLGYCFYVSWMLEKKLEGILRIFNDCRIDCEYVRECVCGEVND